MCRILRADFVDVVEFADLILCLSDGKTVWFLFAVLVFLVLPVTSIFWLSLSALRSVLGLMTEGVKSMR